MFQAEDWKQDNCDDHGAYENRYVDYGPMGKKWTGCPKCANELRKAEEEKAKREHEQMMREHRLLQIMNKARIPAKFKEKTFENFEPVNDKAKARKETVLEYVDTVCSDSHEGKSLIMLGKLGNGKTHLACAMLKAIILSTMKPCLYVTFSEVVRRVKASWKNSSDEGEEDVYRDLARPHVLVIDEVGMQNFTDFEQVVAYEVINARYLAEKPTVLITNLQAKDLAPTIGERCVDRLRENGGKALDFDWSSYRAGSKNG